MKYVNDENGDLNLDQDQAQRMEDDATMESGGTTQLQDPGYTTDDDVENSIAEGYF